MMERQEKIFQHVTKYLTIGFILFGLVMTIYNLFYSTPYYIALSAASILFAFIPAVVYKIFRLKPVYSLTFLSDLFCIFSPVTQKPDAPFAPGFYYLIMFRICLTRL